MKKLKLSKFELDQMPEIDMNSVRAGSGTCNTGNKTCYCDSNDTDEGEVDSDDD